MSQSVSAYNVHMFKLCMRVWALHGGGGGGGGACVHSYGEVLANIAVVIGT